MVRSLGVCLLLAGVVIAADQEAELKLLEGTWVLDDATLGGRDHKEDFKGMKLAVMGTAYTIDFGENSDKGTLTVNGEKNPKWIDITTKKDGPFKGRTLPGVYKLDGGKLVLCLNSEKPDRPEKFEAPLKTPLMLLTFVREKK